MQLTEDQIRRIARQEGKKIVNGGGMVIGGGSGASGTAETAREAQHAKEADHAASADKAKEADHATKAAGLDDAAQAALDNKYLRKDQDDETTHKLTMGEAAVKGDLTLGPNGTYSISKEGVAKLAGVVAEYLKSSNFQPGTAMGFDGQGYGITKGTDGKYTLEIDNLIARMKMIVAELEVHEMSFIGGTVVMSSCGNRVDRVEALDADGNSIATADSNNPTLTIPSDKTADKFRCYFLASDGDRQIKNEWTVGQLARAKTNNIAAPGNYTDYQNRDYWRLVVGVSSAPVTKDGKQYHYIDLSNSTSKDIVLTDAAGTTSHVTLGGVSETLNSLPFAGDNIIGMGHCLDDTRKNVAILSVDSLGWKLYKGIDHYDLPEENIVNQFSIDKTIVTTDHFILRPYAAPKETQTVAVVRGSYSDTATYGHNDLVTYDGQTWIASGVPIGKTIKGERPSATSPYWSLAAAKGIQGDKGDGYSISFLLNNVPVDVINFDTVKGMEGSEVTLEADFYNNAAPANVNKAVITCYDADGNVLGSPIEATNAENIVVDGGNLYLSKLCAYITTIAYDTSGKMLVSKSIGVVRNGVSVDVQSVTYKVINNVDAGAALNWDSVTAQTTYPTQKPDKGKYCYVMTIVTYSDGTTTNTVSTSYTPKDGNDGTSVKVTSTTVEYAGSDSGTTAPTSGWQPSVPQLAQGNYLWTRTTVSYSDGNSTTSYSVGRIGMDGSKGGTTHILYASSDNPQSPNDVVTVIDAQHQYYGTYQDTEINDDNTKYKKVTSWVLIKGNPGIDGHTPNITIGANGNWYIDGKDSGQRAQGNAGHTPSITIGSDGYWYIDGTKTIKAQGEKGVDGTQYRTVEKYAYGDSNTIAPTSGWSDSISGGAPGKYLWNQETAQHKAATDTDWKPDSVTTHCIGYIAKNGENGANFTGVLEHYKATNDGTNAPAVDSSWQSTPNAAGWSANTPYLWNYETVQRDKGGSITTNAHLDGVWGKQGIKGEKGDNYSVVFLLNGARVDVLNFDDVRTLTEATFEADFYNQGTAVNIPKATLTCYDKEGNVLGSPIEIENANNIVADGGNLYLSKDCKTITAVGKDGDNVLFSSSVAVIRSTITYRLIPMSDCSATVKASGTSTSAVFKLSYNLHYKAEKRIGDRSENATIATIAATIEGKDVPTTVNNTEGILKGEGAQSYTSTNRPADSIPVTVTLSDGTVLNDNVPVTMEAGVAIDINQNLGKFSLKVQAMSSVLYAESHQYDDTRDASYATFTPGGGSRVWLATTKDRGTAWFLVRPDGTVYNNVHTYDTYDNASLCDTMATDLYNTRSSSMILVVLSFNATSMTQKLVDELSWWGLDPTAIAPYSGQRNAFAFVGEANLGSGRGWWSLASGSGGKAVVNAMVSNGHVVAQYAGADAAQRRLLLATGIDIEHRKITVTADKFVVNNNSGDTTFYVDEDGNIVGKGNASFKGTITGSTINGGTIKGTTIKGSTINSTNGTSTTTIEGGKLTTNDLEATNGKFSGELNGVSGTFTELRAVSGNLNSVRILLEGDTTQGGRLGLVGNVSNMGNIFYGGDIFSTGAQFGHRGRNILLVNNNTCTLIWTGQPFVPTWELSMLTDNTTNYYRVPLFNLGNIYTLANKAVDVIVFNNSTGDLHYSLFSDCIGKGVDIINANDKHQLYIASNTGYFRLSGGACMRGVYIGTQNIYPSVSYLGAGWFFFGYNDMNW